KPAELLKIESVLCDQIPVVRRFTGRGTVVVDPNTIFVTFICNKDAVAGLQPYPQPIMSWTSALNMAYLKLPGRAPEYRLVC
ncbi:hypothetical protein CFP56_037270, partial [Quercus suber]